MIQGAIRVGVNGYGVIGKRVVEAVERQPDMRLVGVVDLATDYRIAAAMRRGVNIFAPDAKRARAMRDTGATVVGVLDELLPEIDVIVDCTPKGVAAQNIDRYRAVGVKAIVQGGEKPEVTGHSFVAQANYATALGLGATRVVSCNTTSIVRVLGALRSAELLESARGVLIRRATDPWESDHSGIMNTIVPEQHVPSHQGPDAQTVIPDLDIVTMAAKASHTQAHSHYWSIRLRREAERGEVIAALHDAPRIALVRMTDGVVALNSTIELMHDLGRPRGDMWEVALWENVLNVQGDEAFLTYQVDNQAIVIPETIDAIRALTGTVEDPGESIAMTNRSLGVLSDFVRGIHPGDRS